MNMISTLRRTIFLALLSLGLTNTISAHAQDAAKPVNAPQIKFVTNIGEFVAEVYPRQSPQNS